MSREESNLLNDVADWNFDIVKCSENFTKSDWATLKKIMVYKNELSEGSVKKATIERRYGIHRNSSLKWIKQIKE